MVYLIWRYQIKRFLHMLALRLHWLDSDHMSIMTKPGPLDFRLIHSCSIFFSIYFLLIYFISLNFISYSNEYFYHSKHVTNVDQILFLIFWQSRGDPRDIMTEVFKAFQTLKVCWKKIGLYNMKCRWIRNFANYKNHKIENECAMILPTIIKFELQVYETYLSNLR